MNPAGIATASLTLTSKKILNFEAMRKTVEVNLFGSVYCSAHAAFHMAKNEPIGEKKDRGVIVHVSSVAGHEGQRGQVAYSASKGGIMGMTRPMARDLGKWGIRVVTIAPGVFETPMVSKDINPKLHDLFVRDTPLGRLGTPDEFAHFAQSAVENSYLTGCILRLDGGTLLSNV